MYRQNHFNNLMGLPLDANAKVYINAVERALGVKMPVADRVSFNILFNDLKGHNNKKGYQVSNLFPKIIGLYDLYGRSLVVGQDGPTITKIFNSSKINLITPGTYDITWGGTPAFANYGIASNGGVYADTGYTVPNNTTNYSQGVYVYGDAYSSGSGLNGRDMGFEDGSYNYGMYAYANYSDYRTYADVYPLAEAAFANGSSSANIDANNGLLVQNLSGTTFKVIKKGSVIQNRTGAGPIGCGSSTYLFSCNRKNTTPAANTRKFGAGFIASDLTDTEQVSLHNAIQAHKQRLGIHGATTFDSSLS
jgi:hypothetical protein